jgi:hypothetical protein
VILRVYNHYFPVQNSPLCLASGNTAGLYSALCDAQTLCKVRVDLFNLQKVNKRNTHFMDNFQSIGRKNSSNFSDILPVNLLSNLIVSHWDDIESVPINSR